MSPVIMISVYDILIRVSKYPFFVLDHCCRPSETNNSCGADLNGQTVLKS